MVMLSVLPFTLYLDEFLEMYEMLIGEMPAPCPSYVAVPLKKKKKYSKCGLVSDFLIR